MTQSPIRGLTIDDLKRVDKKAKEFYEAARAQHAHLLHPGTSPEWEELPPEVVKFWRNKVIGNPRYKRSGKAPKGKRGPYKRKE